MSVSFRSIISWKTVTQVLENMQTAKGTKSEGRAELHHRIHSSQDAVSDQEDMPLHLEQRSLAYHLHTIWLFTLNDLKSIVYPETAFGIFSALSGPSLSTNARLLLFDILGRLPQIILWNWANLLLFDVANQRLSGSILEDAVNNPWRPLPSQRLMNDEARHLLMLLKPIVFLVSLYLGGVSGSMAMIVLTWDV